MKLCKDCVRHFFDVEEGQEGSFPRVTMAGGILGGVAAALTGSFGFMPLGAITGLAGDIAVCELCGGDDDLYEVTEDEVNMNEHLPFPPRRPPEIEIDDTADMAIEGEVFEQAPSSLLPAPEDVDVNTGSADIPGFDWSIVASPDQGDASGGEGGSPAAGTSSPGSSGSGGAAGAAGAGGTGGDAGGGA